MTPRESLLAAMAAIDNRSPHAIGIANRMVHDHGPALLAALDDAEHYRWLRDNTDPPSGPFAWASNCDYEAKWDAAIDAARKS